MRMNEWVGFHRRGCRAVLFVALLTFWACSPEKSKQSDPKRFRSGVPVSVAVVSVTQKTVPVQIPAIGYVEPYSTVSVKAQIEAILKQVHFKEGQDVKAGDLLFTMDARPYEQALAQADANLARDKIQAENARRDAERDASLFKRGIVSEEQRDQTRATAAALEAAIQADIAAVERAKINRGYCTIRSPIDGRTGTLKVHEGNLVKGEDVLVVIVQTVPIYVSFSVAEQRLPEIRTYMAAGKLKVEAAASKDLANPAVGELSFVDNMVDPTLGTIRLKGTFANKDRALWPEQFVNVVLTLTEQRDRIVVEARAIQKGQQGQYVFVVKPDSTVEMRPVVLDRMFGSQAVISKGLAAREKVVSDGHLRLVPGARVIVQDVATTPSTSLQGPARGESK